MKTASGFVRLALHAMATRFEAVLAGGDEALLRAAGEEALAEIEEQERRLSAFRPDSLLRRINDHAACRSVGTDSEMMGFLVRCRELWRQTGGAFDPTVGPLMRAHGFRGCAPVRNGDAEAARARTGMHLVAIDQARAEVRFLVPGVELDPGAVGKGWAIDRAAEVLRRSGVECALLHGGSSTAVAIGAPPGEDGWRVRIAAGRRGAHSDAPDGPVVRLRDQALSVSAPHGRSAGGAGHVLDPRTGRPAQGAAVAAAVCDRATDADAWSTALLALGGPPEHAPDGLTAIVRTASGDWRAAGPVAPILDRPMQTMSIQGAL